MEVKWIKIVTDIFDDEKMLLIESMPDADSIIVIWFKLLCLAGKQNNSGVFQMGHIAYTDEMFSTVFRRPISVVRLALKIFEDFGMVEILNNTVTIPNWEKHQSIEKLGEEREKTRLRVAKFREKQKALLDSNVTVTLRNDTDKNKIREEKEKKEDNKHNEASPFDDFDENVKKALDNFSEMRKRLKKPLTENAKVRLAKRLKELSSEPAEQVLILNQSEDKCWLDIYPLKKDGSEKTARTDGYGESIYADASKLEV